MKFDDDFLEKISASSQPFNILYQRSPEEQLASANKIQAEANRINDGRFFSKLTRRIEGFVIGGIIFILLWLFQVISF